MKKKAACLRMSDGGALYRWANRLVGNNPDAMRLRNRSAEHDQRTPPPPPPPPPPQQEEAPPPIRFRHGGGPVPGRGQGDKIPALYEPGEFVVSNEMLEDNPGLEDALHHMRNKTLRADGKDPAEVDAKQVKGGMLRAAFGADGSWDGKFAPEFERNAIRPEAGRAVPTPPPPVTAPATTPATTPATARAFGEGLRRAAGPAGRVGPAGVIAGVTMGSAAESAATPTENYYRRFGMDPSAPSLGKDLAARAGGVMTDLGASILDAPVNALNAASRMFGGKGNIQLPGGSFEDIVSRQDLGQLSPIATRPTLRPPIAPTLASPDPTQRALRQGTVMPTMSRESPRDLEIGPEQGVVYRNGNSFSGVNVSGYGRQNVVPGMSQDLIDQTLTNKDGSRWSAADNARMAANLRDGRDPLEGTSGAQKLSPLEEAQRRFPPGTFGRASALRAAQEQEQNALTKRTQDIALFGHQQTAATARAQALYQQMKDDRQYQFDEKKFGAEQAKNNWEAGQKAQKDITDQIASFIPPGEDGKPDMNTAAQYMGALQAHLAGRIDQLRKHVALNPRDKHAAGELEGLETRKMAQIPPDEVQKFVTAMELKRKMAETATGPFNPFNTSMSDFSGAPTSLRYKPAMIGGDYEVFQGKQRVGETPARHVDGGPFSQRSLRYESLKEPK